MVCFEERIERCCEDLRVELRRLNTEVQDRVAGQLHRAVSNLSANIRYQFLESHGPRRKTVTTSKPLFPRYMYMLRTCRMREHAVEPPIKDPPPPLKGQT